MSTQEMHASLFGLTPLSPLALTLSPPARKPGRPVVTGETLLGPETERVRHRTTVAARVQSGLPSPCGQA